jgi:hypothetical protein
LQNEQQSGVGNESVCETGKLAEEIILLFNPEKEAAIASPQMLYFTELYTLAQT